MDGEASSTSSISYQAPPARPPPPRYSLQPYQLRSEDILFCVDVDPESSAEMKASGPRGRPVTRLDSIKQALLLFVHAKLSMSPGHRFAFATLGSSFSWVRKEFVKDADSAIAVIRAIKAADTPFGFADLTQLFAVANHEAKKSRDQGRILRVILIYCRSSVRPQHKWPISPKLFTVDVIYLHSKPGPENCPQKVYDSLVDALEHVSEYEGYILESGQGLTRVICRYFCVLLSHPQQRCVQDNIDFPKSLTRKSPPAADTAQSEETVSVSTL